MWWYDVGQTQTTSAKLYIREFMLWKSPKAAGLEYIWQCRPEVYVHMLYTSVFSRRQHFWLIERFCLFRFHAIFWMHVGFLDIVGSSHGATAQKITEKHRLNTHHSSRNPSTFKLKYFGGIIKTYQALTKSPSGGRNTIGKKKRSGHKSMIDWMDAGRRKWPARRSRYAYA